MRFRMWRVGIVVGLENGEQLIESHFVETTQLDQCFQLCRVVDLVENGCAGGLETATTDCPSKNTAVENGKKLSPVEVLSLRVDEIVGGDHCKKRHWKRVILFVIAIFRIGRHGVKIVFRDEKL